MSDGSIVRKYGFRRNLHYIWTISKKVMQFKEESWNQRCFFASHFPWKVYFQISVCSNIKEICRKVMIKMKRHTIATKYTVDTVSQEIWQGQLCLIPFKSRQTVKFDQTSQRTSKGNRKTFMVWWCRPQIIVNFTDLLTFKLSCSVTPTFTLVLWLVLVSACLC